MKARTKKSAEQSIHSGVPKVIAAGEFKARCLQLMDEVGATGETLIITKRGREVARLVPPGADKKKFRPLAGRMKGSVTIHGDIISPVDIEWEGDARNI